MLSVYQRQYIPSSHILLLQYPQWYITIRYILNGHGHGERRAEVQDREGSQTGVVLPEPEMPLADRHQPWSESVPESSGRGARQRAGLTDGRPGTAGPRDRSAGSDRKARESLDRAVAVCQGHVSSDDGRGWPALHLPGLV
jgi:hypothetical protein